MSMKIQQGSLPIMDKIFLVIFIIIDSLKVSSGSLAEPIYLWPFHDRAMAYEVVGSGRDAMHPTLDGCFRVSPILYNSETRFPLFLDGTRESYIDINITNHESSFTSFGFFFAYYPHVTSGTIFHYQSNNSTSDYISQITIKLDQGHIRIRIKDGSDGDLASFSVAASLSKMEWQHISLSYHRPTGDVEIHSNFSLVATVNVGNAAGLALPGVMRIGAGANYDDLWVGSVRCMMMYEQGRGFDNRHILINWHCYMGWNYVNKVPQCFTSPTYPIVTLLWPFDEQAGADEVKTLTPPSGSTTPRYQHVLKNMNGKKAIYFDGSKYSNTDLKLRKNLLQGDFSLAMMIFLNTFNGSGIFKIKNETSLTGLNGINVFVTPEGYARVIITSGSTECLDFLVSIYLTRGEWHLLAVQRFSIAQMTSIIVDGSEYTSQDTCVTSSQTNGDLILTVGGDTNNSDRYLGSIRCIGLFNSPLWPTTAQSTLLQTCIEEDVLSYNSTVEPIHEDNPLIRNMETKGYPNRAIRNGHLGPIKTLLNMSKIGCARTCLETKYCRSFSVHNTICKIFDFVTMEGLIEQKTSIYFVRQ